MPEQCRGDVQRQPGRDQLGGEQAPEVVWCEGDRLAGVAQVGRRCDVVEEPAHYRGRQYFLPGADSAGEQVRERFAVDLLVGS